MLFAQTPRNWYRYDADFSVSLLHHYIQGIEQQISDGIKEFREHSTTEIVDENTDDARTMRRYGMLDDETWHLETVFEEYFPNLQRRGALITLYSFLEYELAGLCRLFARELGLTRPPDVSYIGTAFDFLKDRARLSIDGDCWQWEEIQNIRLLRNCLTHNDGRLAGAGPRVTVYVQDCKQLRGDNEVIILKDYLDHVLNTFNSFFQAVDEAIQVQAGRKDSGGG